MNMKRLVFAVIAAYIAMAVVGFGLDMLTLDYMASMVAIQRTAADLVAHTIWMLLGYFLFTILFCYIYVQNHEGKGWMEGARYGLLIGLMMSGMSMVLYAVLPIDGMESLLSAAIGIIVYVVGGIVTSLVYKTDG